MCHSFKLVSTHVLLYCFLNSKTGEVFTSALVFHHKPMCKNSIELSVYLNNQPIFISSDHTCELLFVITGKKIKYTNKGYVQIFQGDTGY